MTAVTLPTGRVVLTYGRFDRLHHGQMQFLRQLSALGSELIVGCATDAQAAAQGRPCTQPFAARRSALEDCHHVSRVIAWDCPGQMRTDIVNYDVWTLALDRPDAGAMPDLTDIAQVLYLPPVQMPSTPGLAALMVAG